jgi:hypothetical protein
MVDTQLEAIRQLHRAFDDARVPYWLFGGWAVDFHVGRRTRPHADVDVAVWLHDLERVRGLLQNGGWRASTDRPGDGYVTFERDGVQLDIAFLAEDDDGTIYTPSDRGRGDWPSESFGADVATMDGVEAHVVRRAALIADKSEPHGPEAAAKDEADVDVLISHGDRTELAE